MSTARTQRKLVRTTNNATGAVQKAPRQKAPIRAFPQHSLLCEMRSQWDFLESMAKGSSAQDASFTKTGKTFSVLHKAFIATSKNSVVLNVVPTFEASTTSIGQTPSTLNQTAGASKRQATRQKGNYRSTVIPPTAPERKAPALPRPTTAAPQYELLFSKEVNKQMDFWANYKTDKNETLVSLELRSREFEQAQAKVKPGSVYRIKHAVSYLCAIHAAVEGKTGFGIKVGQALDSVWSREADLQKRNQTQLEYKWQKPWKKNSIFKGQVPTSTSLQTNLMQVLNRVDECGKHLNKARTEALADPGDEKLQGMLQFRSKELLEMRQLANVQLDGLMSWVQAARDKTSDKQTREYLGHAAEAISNLKSELFSDSTLAGSAVKQVAVPQIGKTEKPQD